MENNTQLIKLDNGISMMKANYLKQEIAEYQGNPFIEALPPILSFEEAYDLLSYSPPYDDKERNLPVQHRLHAILRLRRIFEPLERSLDLERTFSRLIRTSYINRNPLDREHVVVLNELYQKLVNGEKGLTLNADLRTTALSFSILGYPGVGKTSAVERILSLYPQVLLHQKPIHVMQVVWLKINCPHDGSLKTLCMSFFQKIDELLGSNYYKKFGHKQNSISSMIIRMGQLARSHGISVLVIDEIQHLLSSKKDVPEQMMNFFVTLVNEIGISVVTIGTMRAKSLLQKDFRQARRSADVGNVVWQQMKKDENWDVFVMGLWDYQWTKTKVELDEEYSSILYEESQGIKDIAVKIYMLAQTKAIVSGLETITPSLLKSIVSEYLSIVKPMLEALKSGSTKKLESFEDISPFDVEQFISDQIEEVDMKELIQMKSKHKQEENKKKSTSTLSKVVMSLVDLEIDSKVAENTASYILKKYNNELSVMDAMKLTLEHIEELNQNRQKRNQKRDTENTLCSLIRKGRNRKKTAYESLKDGGLIASPIEEFTL